MFEFKTKRMGPKSKASGRGPPKSSLPLQITQPTQYSRAASLAGSPAPTGLGVLHEAFSGSDGKTVSTLNYNYLGLFSPTSLDYFASPLPSRLAGSVTAKGKRKLDFS